MKAITKALLARLAFDRIDRHLLLHFPRLWLMRVHYVFIYGPIAILVSYMLGRYYPLGLVEGERPAPGGWWLKDKEPDVVPQDSIPEGDGWFIVPALICALIIAYWGYLQIRNRGVPFVKPGGRDWWIVPAHACCLLVFVSIPLGFIHGLNRHVLAHAEAWGPLGTPNWARISGYHVCRGYVFDMASPYTLAFIAFLVALLCVLMRALRTFRVAIVVGGFLLWLGVVTAFSILMDFGATRSYRLEIAIVAAAALGAVYYGGSFLPRKRLASKLAGLVFSCCMPLLPLLYLVIHADWVDHSSLYRDGVRECWCDTFDAKWMAWFGLVLILLVAPLDQRIMDRWRTLPE